jgi:hypothetical protein
MAEFTVTLVETVRYYVVVEAENAEQAGDDAREMWANSEDPTDDFNGQGDGVQVLRVNRVA